MPARAPSLAMLYGCTVHGDAPRLIAHLDMDAFYASVELLRYPELRAACPVVIGGGRRHQPETLSDGTRRFFRLRDYTGRGVLTTSTYEARARWACSRPWAR